MDIPPRLSFEDRAVPRVTLRPALRETTEYEPGIIWYLNFTCLRVYGDVSGDLYSR